jgi:sugar/nucleoside kinase (ribokinase family)
MEATLAGQPDLPGDGPHVSLVGPLNLDLFIRGTAPLEREVLNAWVGPSDVDLVVAGSIGYTAQVFRRLGARVELHSHVGEDAFGEHILRSIEDDGIESRFLVRRPGVTAIAIYAMLFGGHKRPMTYRLPGFEPWPADPPLVRAGESVPDLVHSGGLLHFPGMWHRGLATAFAAARHVGTRTAIDPQFPLDDCPTPWLPHIADVLAESDILLCDDGELSMIFGRADLSDGIAAAHASGPGIVAVKRGAAGSVVSDGAILLEQPAVPVPPEAVREAVGAGDAFDAGFLDALVRGHPLGAAAAFATATATLTLTGRGGAEGITGRSAVGSVLSHVPGSAARPTSKTA